MISASDEIIKRLTKYLQQNPQIRVGQALINLKIIEVVPGSPSLVGYTVFKDPWNNHNEDILKRMV